MRLSFRPTVLLAAFRDALPLVYAIGGATVAYAVSAALMPDLESVLRLAGTLLQVFGLATVALGITQVRELFGQPSITQSIVAWLRLLASAFVPPKSVVAKLEAAISTNSALSARLTVGVPEGAALHKRITALERNLASFRTEYDDKVVELERSIAGSRSAADKAVEDTRREIAAVDDKIVALATGGVRIELVGLVWLLLGVVATGLPAQILWQLE